MASEVSICSNALLMLGAKPINSFEEAVIVNGTNRAQLCANLWDVERDNILRSHPWNCATKRAVLSPETAGPAFEYRYQFALPGDFLRVCSINQYPADKYDYRIEGRKLLCDEQAVYLRYIWRNQDVSSWDAMLIKVAQAHMAHVLAMPITGQITVRDSFAIELRGLMQSARTVDAQEEPPETLGDFPLLEARYSAAPRR
jgi:hypothetical protein